MLANNHEHRFDNKTLKCPCGEDYNKYLKAKSARHCSRAKSRHTEIQCPICSSMLFMPNAHYANYDCYSCGISIPKVINLRGLEILEYVRNTFQRSKRFDNLNYFLERQPR